MAYSRNPRVSSGLGEPDSRLGTDEGAFLAPNAVHPVRHPGRVDPSAVRGLGDLQNSLFAELDAQATALAEPGVNLHGDYSWDFHPN